MHLFLNNLYSDKSRLCFKVLHLFLQLLGMYISNNALEMLDFIAEALCNL